MAADCVVISQEMAQRSMLEQVRELWDYRALLWAMVERDLRLRYKGSVLGILWSMVHPLMQSFIMTLAFGYIMNAGGKNMSAYMICAFVPWMFFQTTILDSSQSILNEISLIKKVYFPREVPVLAKIGANFINMLISLCVFVVYRWGVLSLFGKPGPPPRDIIMLPVIILTVLLLTTGISLWVAAANVFYEDVKFITSLVLQALMYLSPIIYFAEQIIYSPRIPRGIRPIIYRIYMLNPISYSITAFKQAFFPPHVIDFWVKNHHVSYITSPFNYHYCAIALVVSAVMCVYGYARFNAAKWRFTERA